MTTQTTTRALLRLLGLAMLTGLSALPTAVAQAPGGPGGPGGPPRKPLPLEAKRTAEFTATTGTWMSLDVSPDGKTIVFDLLGDLYTMPIGGGKATAITNGLAYDGQPRFSPDGKNIVFVSDRSGGDNVWTLEVATGDTTQLTQGNGNQFISPAYSPDGKYVVVSRGGGAFPASKLQMYHVDGGSGLALVPATPQNAQLKQLGATFSPDGQRIWFAARSGDWHYNAIFPQYQLGYYDRATGTTSRMTGRYGSAFRPALSPDGKWLTYATRHDANTGLRIRNLATGAEEWLAYPIQRDDMEARSTLDVIPGYAFTPDSKAVIIAYGGGIWRVGVDKSTPVQIPFSADVKAAVGPEVKFAYRIDTAAMMTVRQIRDPIISPDGKRMVFTAVDRLYVKDLPDGAARRISTADAGEYHPNWSPDGKTVVWVSWADAAGGHIMKADVSGRAITPVQVTRVSALYTNPAWNPDGSRIVATRNAARDLVEASGNGGNVLGGDFIWLPAGGGDATVIAPTAGLDVAHFVVSEPDRIYASGFGQGLVSFRWDGTDLKTHLRVIQPQGFGGMPTVLDPAGELHWLPRRVAPVSADALASALSRELEGGPGGFPASLIMMSPKGGRAVAQVQRDLYEVVVPNVGSAPTVSVAGGGPVPVQKLTDVGGEFPTWHAGGDTVFFALGNTLFTYDLSRARVVNDSTKDANRAKADSARVKQITQDSIKQLKARADSLIKARSVVPDSIKIKIFDLENKLVSDSVKAAQSAKARADSLKTRPDSAKAKADSAKGAQDSTKAGPKKDEKPGYHPVEQVIKVEVARDLPTGTVVLRGGRAITMKGKEIIENADVLVRDNRIVAIGPRGQVTVPSGARIIDVTGKTIMPGMIDIHYHAQWLIPDIHPGQAWQYLTTLAYGVTTTRDPQTAVSDILSYQDRVEMGAMIGPRIYSTGPGVFAGDNIRDADHAKTFLKRYSQYWDTKTLKMYMTGNRQQRQWIIMAAKELGIMPTTEGGLDFRLDMTHAMDGYPGVEHALPITPIYDDVVQLFKASQTTNTPTLLVSYGGPFGENYFYTTENVIGDRKLATFMPKGQIDARALRRGGSGGYQQGGWFHKDEYVFSRHAEFMKKMIEGGARAAVGAHGQIQGIGNHWELWAMASGGMSNHDALRTATIYGAEAVGMGADVGSLEAGKMADILVLDQNPLDNIRNSNSIRYVMKNGRLYEGETLNEIYPRARPLAKQWWADGGPRTAAGIK